MKHKGLWKTSIAASLMLLLGSGTVANAQTATPENAAKSFTKTEVISKADAKKVLKQLPASFKASKYASQFEVVNVEKDDLNFTHYTLKPKANKAFATNQEIKVHVNDQNEVVFINGDLNGKQVTYSNAQKITQGEAVRKAFEAIGEDTLTVKNAAGHDVVNKAELAVNTEENKLVYAIELIYLQPEAARWSIEIDAETGAIVKQRNLLEEVVGSGTGLDGKTKTINVTKSGSTYNLTDTTRAGDVITLDAKNTTTTAYYVTSNSTSFTTTNHRAAVDAHYYAGQVYDYYLNTFGRNSYDNRGADIESIVHYGNKYNNAAWTGQYMIYGDGDGTNFSAFSGANDVIAHELTHAVTETTANLAYENQPGALNESFSDVFGYFVDPEDWLMGEDIYTPKIAGDALRSLSNPEKYGQPAHMNNYQNLPNTSAGDWGGVHTNSGIPNKAAYNTIQAIGKTKAEKIYYRALTQYLTSNSQFKDAKAALVQAATDLYGTTEANAVKAAWVAVGVN